MACGWALSFVVFIVTAPLRTSCSRVTQVSIPPGDVPCFCSPQFCQPRLVQESGLSLAGVIAKIDSWEMPLTGKCFWQTTQPSYPAFIWVNQCSDAYLGHKYSDINCIYSCDSCVLLPVIYLALLSFHFTPCGAVKSAAYHWQSSQLRVFQK